MIKLKSQNDLNDLLSTCSSLNHWIGSKDIRKHSKLINTYREKEDFSVLETYQSMKEPKIISHSNLSILFASFSPYLSEIEGTGFPFFAKKSLPNSNVDLYYQKGLTELIYNLSDSKFQHKNTLDTKYDLVIARSDILLKMSKNKAKRKILKKSHFKINVKTMSLKSNYKKADIYFEEEDFCPPVSPDIREKAKNFLTLNQKKDWILVPGSIWHVKNQLSFFENLDSSILKNFKIVIVGKVTDETYAEQIVEICDKKEIDYLFIGEVSRDFLIELLCLSKITIIPMDMRTFQQEKGYPRLLGESLNAKSIPLCYYPVTIPSYFSKAAIQYNDQNMNVILDQTISNLKDKQYLAKYNWGSMNFENFCYMNLKKCLDLAQLK